MSREFLINCDCNSDEHAMIWRYDPDIQMYYISIQLIHRPWHERILHTIKYILGYQSKYGHWNDLLLTKENLKHLLDRTKYD